MDTPCYVISSNEFKDSMSYEDGWCYGPSEYLGTAVDWSDVRDIIKADIRKHFAERNGLPIYTVSDHGNEGRTRAIRLRKAPETRRAHVCRLGQNTNYYGLAPRCCICDKPLIWSASEDRYLENR